MAKPKLDDLSLSEQDRLTEFTRVASRILTNGFPGWQFTSVIEMDVGFLIGTKHKDWDSWTEEFQYTWSFPFDDWYCASACQVMLNNAVVKVSEEMATRTEGSNIKPLFEMDLGPLTDLLEQELHHQLNQDLMRKVDEDLIKALVGTMGNIP